MLNANQWIEVTLFGGLFGLIGQFIRMQLGMRKLRQENAGNKEALDAAYDGKKLWFSLATGAVAGALTAVGFGAVGDINSGTDFLAAYKDGTIPVSFILGLMVAGYSGADVIDGFVNTRIKR